MGSISYLNHCLKRLGARHVIYFRAVTSVAGQLFWVVILYLLSELLIWSLSLALRLARSEYFSTILGMVVVFLSMSLLHQICETSDEFYHLRIKSKASLRYLAMSRLGQALTGRKGRLYQQEPRTGFPSASRGHQSEGDTRRKGDWCSHWKFWCDLLISSGSVPFCHYSLTVISISYSSYQPNFLASSLCTSMGFLSRRLPSPRRLASQRGNRKTTNIWP